MANQFFDPSYYLKWDDGTYGKINISDAEGAATQRAKMFFEQSIRPDAVSGPFPDEQTQSDYQKRAQAWLSKYETVNTPKIPNPNELLADRPIDSEKWRRKSLPDILQPGKQQGRLNFQNSAYSIADANLQAILKEFGESPTWRQAELQVPYDIAKGKADGLRVSLNQAKQNLANAQWLATRDAEMLKLAKENPDFDANWKTVRRIYANYETGVHPSLAIDAKIGVTKTMMGFYELQQTMDKLNEKFNPEINQDDADYLKLKKQLAELTDEKEKLFKDVEKKTIGTKEFKSAHVNASNILADKLLNLKGVKIAGRLLAAVPYQDVKDLVNVARTGGMADSHGNIVSPEDMTQDYVDTNYDSTLRYLVENSVPVTEEMIRENDAKAEKKAKEVAIKKKFEIVNDKLVLKNIDH